MQVPGSVIPWVPNLCVWFRGGGWRQCPFPSSPPLFEATRRFAMKTAGCGVRSRGQTFAWEFLVSKKRAVQHAVVRHMPAGKSGLATPGQLEIKRGNPWIMCPMDCWRGWPPGMRQRQVDKSAR